MTLMINADAVGEQKCLEEGAPRKGVRGWEVGRGEEQASGKKYGEMKEELNKGEENNTNEEG